MDNPELILINDIKSFWILVWLGTMDINLTLNTNLEKKYIFLNIILTCDQRLVLLFVKYIYSLIFI